MAAGGYRVVRPADGLLDPQQRRPGPALVHAARSSATTASSWTGSSSRTTTAASSSASRTPATTRTSRSTRATRSRSTRPTARPHDRLDLHLQGCGRGGRGRALNRWASGTRTRSRSGPEHQGVPQRHAGERLHQHGPGARPRAGFVGVQNHGAGRRSATATSGSGPARSSSRRPARWITIPGNSRASSAAPRLGAGLPEHARCGTPTATACTSSRPTGFPPATGSTRSPTTGSWTENYGANGVRDGGEHPAHGRGERPGRDLQVPVLNADHDRGEARLRRPDAADRDGDAEPGAAGLDGRVHRAGHCHVLRPGRVAGSGHVRVPGRRWPVEPVHRAGVEISAPGPHTVEYRAKDAAGNTRRPSAPRRSASRQKSDSPVDFIGDVPSTLAVTVWAAGTTSVRSSRASPVTTRRQPRPW